MNLLLVSQSNEGSYVNIINQAVKKNGGRLGIITGKYQNIDDNVEIIPSKRYDSTSFKSRLKTWLAFVFDARSHMKRVIDQYDAVMFTSNPPINQLLVKYALKKKKKCIYLVWDIYPNTVEKMFGNKLAPVTNLWRKLNHSIYRKCDAVLTIGHVMADKLAKDYPDVHIEVIPYHADTEFIKPIPKEENDFAAEHNLTDKKVFMYSGKMGAGHGFDEILKAAEQLKERKDIQFLLIGHGSSFEKVKNDVNEMELTNTLVLPYQPFEKLPYTLGSADVFFVTIKEDTDGLFLPSKVYDGMASESAILSISGGQNDVANMVERDNIGLQVKSGDVDALLKAIIKFADDEEFLNNCKKNARKLADEVYSIEKVTKDYAELFKKL